MSVSGAGPPPFTLAVAVIFISEFLLWPFAFEPRSSFLGVALYIGGNVAVGTPIVSAIAHVVGYDAVGRRVEAAEVLRGIRASFGPLVLVLLVFERQTLVLLLDTGQSPLGQTLLCLLM